MLKSDIIQILYINVRHEIEEFLMNGILAKSSENKLHGVLSPKNSEAVETAGSLAMNTYQSLFAVNNYDEFSSSNPFAVDYSMYSDCGDCIADSGFLSSFSSAMSVIGSEGGAFSTGGGDCGFSSCGSSGGFASVC